MDTSKLARENNLQNVLVTNGYINSEPLKELAPFIDAANIDVKSFNPDFYKKQSGGKLEPVLENVKYLFEAGIHLELTTLLIKGLNDEESELKELFNWIKEISSDIPLHLSRYFPNYKMERPATPEQRMEEVYELAKNYLNFVYLGNVRSGKGQNTVCPECGTTLISRNIYKTSLNLEEDGKCPQCEYQLPGEF